MGNGYRAGAMEERPHRPQFIEPGRYLNKHFAPHAFGLLPERPYPSVRRVSRRTVASSLNRHSDFRISIKSLKTMKSMLLAGTGCLVSGKSAARTSGFSRANEDKLIVVTRSERLQRIH